MNRRGRLAVRPLLAVALAQASAPLAPAAGAVVDPALPGATQAAMNTDRAANGLPALAWNAQLAGFAQTWAAAMAQSGSLTHQDLNTILTSGPFTWVAEDILVAAGGT